MSLWELVERRADDTPGALLAIDHDGRQLTFAEYAAWCSRVAAGLAARGVGRGTRVSWVLPTRLEALVLAGALARLGAVQNPILPIYRHREVGFITAQSGCELLVVPGPYRGFDYVPMAEEVAAACGAAVLVVDPDLPEGDPATLSPPDAAAGPVADPVRWLFYSSGTTADPKGARHTDATLAAADAAMQWALQLAPGDRVSVVFPITHIGGVVWLFNALQSGATLLVVESFDAAGTARWLGEQGCTIAGSGTVFLLAYIAAQQQLAPGQRLLPAVRAFNAGGSAKPATLFGQVHGTFGVPVLSAWGLTEAPIVTFVHPDDPDEKKATTEGRACPGARVRAVVDGAEVPAGREGELQVRGPQVCHGYLDPALDAEAFTTDGWFRTGDVGVIDEGGWVTITGRLKDVIIRKGENISAKEIEDLLHAHPKVHEAAVVGVPDELAGERACAVVVAGGDEPLAFAEMIEHLGRAGLSRHKLPEQLVLVAALPRNPTGKVLKRELRSALAAGELDGVSVR